MKTKLRIYSLGITLFTILEARAQSPSLPASNSIPVTVDNFIRAETDRTFAASVKQGAFGKFEHLRELAAIDRSDVSSVKTATRFIRLASSILMPAQ